MAAILNYSSAGILIGHFRTLYRTFTESIRKIPGTPRSVQTSADFFTIHAWENFDSDAAAAVKHQAGSIVRQQDDFRRDQIRFSGLNCRSSCFVALCSRQTERSPRQIERITENESLRLFIRISGNS